MCEKELLVAYLYDDLGDADRAKCDAHLRGCAECREELNALRGVRADLISWSPPPSELGFRIVREPEISNVVAMTPRGTPASWRAWWTPAAGLAAAAILVLAAAAGLARIEVHSGPQGFTVRTGWSGSSAPAAGQGVPGQNGDVAARDVRLPVVADAELIAALDRRLRALEAATRDASGMRTASTLSARTSDTEIIRRVREMLAQSETKQQGELALRIAQVIGDVEAQRVADLSQIQKGLRGIEATVSTVDAGQREITNYILQAPARQK
jgi:anti-sigma factor RsiW